MPKYGKRRKGKRHPLMEKCSFDEVLQLDDGTDIRVRFDEDIRDRIQDDLHLLLVSRGVKQEIGGKDPDTAMMMRRRAKRQDRKMVTVGDVAEVNSRVRDIHAKAEKTALAQLLQTYIMDGNDDLFLIEEKAGGAIVRLMPPYDKYEVPEDYWELMERRTSGSDLKRLMVRSGHYPAQEPKIDPTSVIEVMLALSAGIIEENPEFDGLLIPFVERAAIGLEWGEARLSEEALGVFLEAVDELLFDSVAESNGDGQRTESDGGISGDTEPTSETESRSDGGKSESDE